MPIEISIELLPSQAADSNQIKRAIAQKLNIKLEQVGEYRVTRKSVDARKAKIKVNLGLCIYNSGEAVNSDEPVFRYQDVRNSSPIVVVGAGPAGLFAALRLIELGLKPIIVERGKPVSDRKRDIAMLSREHNLNPDSNYAFGEGGAGTFSDGKLYTRSKKRGDFKRVLYSLHNHGADENILYEAHPHIGTNKLPGVITKIRETIIDHGGEILFNCRVASIILKNEIATGVRLIDGQIVEGFAVILASGHSARDIYKTLIDQKIDVEAKPFAMGVRVEHPQELIDSIQYHGAKRDEFLPAAAYNLVHQVDGRGVYSFCMCPGGFIVPAATSVGEVVVNGMSPSMRNSRFANSGIVVEIRLEDLALYSKFGELAGLELQNELELLAGNRGAFGVKAPAQRLVDFVDGRYSSTLPICSYHPGVNPSAMHEWLPEFISKRLRLGFTEFGKKMKGFLTNDALILGVESRTSSPVRIPRNPETLQHVRIKGLFPSGEGSGYSGGIVSSAVDGERCAEAVANFLKS